MPVVTISVPPMTVVTFMKDAEPRAMAAEKADMVFSGLKAAPPR